MRILLFSAICFCFVHAMVAFEREVLTELEDTRLTRSDVMDSEAQTDGESACCDRNVSFVDLRENIPTFKIPEHSGVQQMQSSGGQNEKCTSMTLLKVNFQKVDPSTTGCLKKPACGRRMLKIQLELDAVDKRSGFMFNVGDSSTNNGYGGDASTQKCDAEVHATYPSINAYGSDNCMSPHLATLPEILNTAYRFVTLYVSNEHIRITNDIGLSEILCSRCLFCLGGQPDNQNQNEDIYIGLNRVVSNTYRRGTGVCSAALSWECPCSDW